ncbi:MAG TPA: tetratricopeptide repeat protein [Terriglobales bacterium]|nr:tetratricopeptide repeat protein [Terriglobales bacterium]
MFRNCSWRIACCVLLASVTGFAQTFEINGQSSSPSSSQGKKSPRTAGKGKSAVPSSDTGMGWGSSIEVARQARAAQQALDKGDYKAAANYAERAAKAAPQNADFWFLLGYAARLAGRYPTSVDAYNHGLQIRPSSIPGLSGLAQTYARMGRNDQAKELLQKVLAANPRSAEDLRLAGELFLFSDPKQSLTYFQRAEAVQSNPRTELLMARAYERVGNRDQAKKWLEAARSKAPRNPEVLRSVAAYYRETGQYALALETLKSIPAKDANSVAELAFTYQLAGEKKQAADLYMRAADMAKGQIDIQLNASQALVNAGDFGRAETLLKRAEGLDSAHYRLHAVRGQLYDLENRPEEAIKEYQLALSHLPESVAEGVLYPISLHVSLYQLYRDTANTSAAEREAQTARALIQPMDIQDASRPEFLRLRAAIEMAFNNVAAAEKDLKEAMSLQPNSTNIVLNYANLLWKANRKPEAVQMYQKALQLAPTDAAALGAMGYLAREMGDPKAAEMYFNKLASLHPDDYVPYLALGDMYTERREFARAQASYEKAHKLAPTNPLIVAGAINSALEGHQIPTAKSWLDRANAAMLENPQVMREHERYLTFTKNYQASADLGYKVIQKLPRDPEAPVYLAYDLLFLNQYQEAMDIVQRFQPVLPKDKDLPLIAGYVHAHNGEFQEAINDFTRALERDTKMATGYMNRGYVENDVRLASKAEQDFRKAIELRPDYGEAHLGLAYSYLQLRHSKAALKEADIAEKLLGESRALHLARAEGYRQRVMLAKAIPEYQAALKSMPDDGPTYLALSDAEYRLHRYDESINTLNTALKQAGQDPMIYAQMARCYARLHRPQDTAKAVEMAERTGGTNSKVLLATAEALLVAGERDQAIERYGRALELSDADRLDTRLALARLFAQEHNWPDARQQIAMGFAEARVSDASVITAENYLDAADILMSMNEFKTAEQFFQRAQNAGADELAVAIGMANAHLAMGETRSAEALLTSVGDREEKEQNYDYLVSLGNVYRQRQDTYHALAAFARANSLEPDNDTAERAEFELANQEGMQIHENLGVASAISLAPIFEDENIYQMDARLRGVQNSPSLLPLPRRSVETRADAQFRLHLGSFPTINGLFGERNARGTLSFPNELLIEDRNTYDTIFNLGVTPVLRVGNVNFTFTPGLQFTLRRDTRSPLQMNQDLFRQYLYVSSSPIGNWLSFNGDVIREAGPFLRQTLHSRDFSGGLNFIVGRPWGKTAFLTGYAARDLLFRPSIHEYYEASTYGGIQHKFGTKITASALAQYLRAWRVEGSNFAIAQTLRPGFAVEVRPNERWTISASGYWSQGKAFHAYDNVMNSLLISYMKPWRGSLNDGTGSVPVSYPLRFSIGLQQQTFYDFPGHRRTEIVPVVQLTLF